MVFITAIVIFSTFTKILQKVLQKFASITKIIAIFLKYCQKYCKVWKYCKLKVLQKVLQNSKVLKKVLQNSRSGKNFSCGILYWILIGSNYFYIIHLSLIYLHFFVTNSLWCIKLFPYVICWIQKLCLLYNFFDKYIHTILKYYLKNLIDQWTFLNTISI